MRVLWASWPQMEAMLVPSMSDEVRAASRPSRVKGSRPTVSGTHSVPKPSASTRAA